MVAVRTVVYLFTLVLEILGSALGMSMAERAGEVQGLGVGCTAGAQIHPCPQ